MPARIEFDYEKAIDSATRLFWQKGYAQTSLRDLLKAMEIGEGSFYNTFKSKRALYVACLKHYDETVSKRRLAALQNESSIKQGIRAFFKVVLNDLKDPRTPRICLLAGSLSGDVLADRTLNRRVLGDMRVFQDVFTDRLREGVLSGELSAGFDPEVTAPIILTYLQGLFRVIRVLQSHEQIEKQIDVFLAGLGV